MLARDVMTTNIVSVSPDASADQAVALMLEKHISGLPVLNPDGTIAGILTEGDFLRRSEIATQKKRSRWLHLLMSSGRLAEEYARSSGRHVAEIMTSEVFTAGEETPVADIVDVMAERGIKRVPVLRGKVVAGIITRADILRGLARFMRPGRSDAPHDDAEILSSIQTAFAQSDCITTGLIDVSVKDGNVELEGAILDERQRAAIHVAVENVAGVKTIHDHLSWIEPVSGTVLPSPEDSAAEKAGTNAA